MNPWKVILITAILSTIVSFLVAGVIHLLCLFIRRFAKTAQSMEAEISAPQGAPQPGVEIAVAIAAVKACIAK